MSSHIGVGEIDIRVITRGFRYVRFEIVRDDDLRHAAEELESAFVKSNTVSKRLSPGSFSIRVVACAKYGDEYLSLVDRPVAGSVTGIV
jgi:hypothetical protein